MIYIVDYKTGNLGSIKNMLKKIGEPSEIISDPNILLGAKKIVLPGVGAFDKGVSKLKDSGMWEVLNKKVLVEKIPILGICLGAQLMTKGSEEGDLEGLGWINANTIKFQVVDKKKFKIPHMGWNQIEVLKESALMKNMYPNPRFYFVHSYYMRFNNIGQALFQATYEDSFHAAFEKDNILGVQFHPEKSHKFGMRLLENFVNHY